MVEKVRTLLVRCVGVRVRVRVSSAALRVVGGRGRLKYWTRRVALLHRHWTRRGEGSCLKVI